MFRLPIQLFLKHFFVVQSAIEDVQRRNFSVEYFFDPINPYLVLKIDRKNIVQSALTELSRQGSMDIKKPLMVTFLGEEAVDAGGLKKVRKGLKYP